MNLGLRLCLLVSLLLSSPTDAAACDCIPLSTDEFFERSDVVFRGRVVGMESVPDRGFKKLRVRFQATRAWKGVDAEYVEVETSSSGAACGYTRFRKSESYLVFARRDEINDVATGVLLTDGCSGTQRIDRAGKILSKLGDGVPLREPRRDPESLLPTGNAYPMDRSGFSAVFWGAAGSVHTAYKGDGIVDSLDGVADVGLHASGYIGHLALRLVVRAEVGGGESGLRGRFAADSSAGFIWKVGTGHGPFGRIGLQGQVEGDDHYALSTFSAPAAALGYTLIRRGLSFEFGGRVAPLLTGSYDVDDREHDLGGAPQVDAFGWVQLGDTNPSGLSLGTFFASARYSRLFADPVANVVHGQICASYIAMLCVRGSILDGHPRDTTSGARIARHRLSLVLGYGAQQSKSGAHR